jgi:hypothetical protein
MSLLERLCERTSRGTRVICDLRKIVSQQEVEVQHWQTPFPFTVSTGALIYIYPTSRAPSLRYYIPMGITSDTC